MSDDHPNRGVAAQLAIADPPYLGRAALWYGGKGRSKQGSLGRAVGRGCLGPEYHPDARKWDDPAQHCELMTSMDAQYDGWALAASGKTLASILAHGAALGGRLAIWHVTNAIPDGARVRNTWEAVLYKCPTWRRAVGTGQRTIDHLTAGHPTSGFVGSKPKAWTHWVLDLLGYQAGDHIDDLFPGSGSITNVTSQILL